VTRAYRGLVFGGGSGGTDGLRSRVARGRPNWWVILAVSLGLMALLVATAGSSARGPAPATQARGGPGEPAVHISPGPGLLWSAGTGAATRSTTTTTTVATTTPSTSSRLPSGTAASVATTRQTSASGVGGSAGGGAPPAPAPTTTVAPAPATTTTTGASPVVAADRTQTQGYLNPPTEPSDKFGFTGTGAMEISVVWSGNTYLTMQVSCPNGGQSVGGTGAMAASLPDAGGSCLATVTEPASETTSLTYTISIGPAGG
jgi:hypothetical protein